MPVKWIPQINTYLEDLGEQEDLLNDVELGGIKDFVPFVQRYFEMQGWDLMRNDAQYFRRDIDIEANMEQPWVDREVYQRMLDYDTHLDMASDKFEELIGYSPIRGFTAEMAGFAFQPAEKWIKGEEATLGDWGWGAADIVTMGLPFLRFGKAGKIAKISKLAKPIEEVGRVVKSEGLVNLEKLSRLLDILGSGKKISDPSISFIEKSFPQYIKDIKNYIKLQGSVTGAPIKIIDKIRVNISDELVNLRRLYKAEVSTSKLGELDPMVKKLSGALENMLQNEKVTRQLYKIQRGEKAILAEEQLAKQEGYKSLWQALSKLKEPLEKGDLIIPDELKLLPKDVEPIVVRLQGMDIKTLREMGLTTYDNIRGQRALAKLAGLVTDETGQVTERLVKSEIKILGKLIPELKPMLDSYTSFSKKAWTNIVDLLNMPRALLASTDLSATLRQGAILLARDPSKLPAMMKWQFKTVFSSKNWKTLDALIKDDPLFKVFERSGGYLAPEPGTVVKLAGREETFMSNIASKIPLVRLSERPFTAGLNYLRFQSFKRTVNIANKYYDEMFNVLGKQFAENTPEFRRAFNALKAEKGEAIEGLAKIVNYASGRGDFPKLFTGGFANAVFFSPRLVASRFQLIGKMFSSNPVVRKEAIRTFVQFMGAGTALSSLAILAGAEIETDPRSSDFGKIRIGNTRLDIWAGYLQWSRFLGQFITGERKTLATQEEIAADRWDTFTRILQSKTSPIANLMIDLVKGETYIGEPMEMTSDTLFRELRNRLTPLFIQDLWDAIETDGLTGGLSAAPGFFGIGITSFERAVTGTSGNPYIQKTKTGGKTTNPYLK